MNEVDLPIGFIDSGLGGLTVLREAIKVMPNEDFIYYGDSANAPYGVKSQEEIKKLTYAVVEKLLDRGVKGLAVACNTATSAAVKSLRVDYPDIPLVGIEPAVKPAVRASAGGNILVMATPMTIAQEKFQLLLKQYEDQANIISIPCAGLMEFVEAGITEGDELDKYFDEHLRKYIDEKTESIVLGCTHYPFLKPEIEKYLNRFEFINENHKIELIDGSLGTAMELRRRLAIKGLLKQSNEKGKVEIINSSNKQEMIDLSYKLLYM